MDRSLQTVLLYISSLYVFLFLKSKKVTSLGDLSLDTEKSNLAVVLGIFVMTLILITAYVIRLYWDEVKHFFVPDTPKPDPEVDPMYETASSVFKNMQENDKNYLMFGRSPQVSSTRDSDILKGDELSSNIGDTDTYGSFTGMTLYGGPDMYEATGMNWGGISISDEEVKKFIANSNAEVDKFIALK